MLAFLDSTAFWVCFGLTYLLVMLYFSLRAMPRGVDYSGPERTVEPSEIKFIYDLSWWEDDQRHSEQQILDTIFGLVSQAEKFVIIDMFLFNTNKTQDGDYLPTTRQLVDLLVATKQSKPDLKLFFITDPINNFYGNYEAGPLQALKQAGIEVIVTDINQLRDRNYMYAGIWRIFLQWFGTKGKGWIPDPMASSEGRKVTLRAILKGINARANHRKLVLCDSGNTYVSLVTSCNIHEASSWLSNIGFTIEDPCIALDCLRAEKAVAKLSDADLSIRIPEKKEPGSIKVRLFTEKLIKKKLLNDINQTQTGDEIKVAMLFLGDRSMVKSLVKASRRGVLVDVVLDQNLQSFGMEKLGLPNQVTAVQLLKRSQGKVRLFWWNNEHDELHSKLMLIKQAERAIVYGGTANFTRRNVGGYTLELMLRIETGITQQIIADVEGYFERICSEPYTYLADPKTKGSLRLSALYYLQQLTGVTTY